MADEGADLRKEGISIPIIVMNPEFSSFNVLFENHLEPEVYSFRLLEALIRETERRGITAYPRMRLRLWRESREMTFTETEKTAA